MNIIQLSDIHIGGDYDGVYDCRLAFEKTVEAIKDLEDRDGVTPRHIVVTGDVCNDLQSTPENYRYVDELLRSITRPGDKIIYMPGNHDNAKVMGETLRFDPDEVKVYQTPEANLLVIPTYSGTFDTNRIIESLYKQTYDESLPMLVFSHFPIGHIQNRFMYSIGAVMKDTEILFKILSRVANVKEFFCGHFHSPGTTLVDGCHIHCAPSTQCLIDPWAKDFKAVADYPGFSLINVNGREVNVDFKFIELGE